MSPIYKTPDEISRMRAAGRLAAQALQAVGKLVAPGVTTIELDRAAHEFIVSRGGSPLFLNYRADPNRMPFPATICASVNEEVVHGIPGERVLIEGDIISVDVGVRMDGFCGDCASTFAVGALRRKAARLLDATQLALTRAISAMRVGGVMRDISAAIQKAIEVSNFAVVRQFVGHGIGEDMHEPPQVANYVPGWRESLASDREVESLKLAPGLVLAIEPMATAGGCAVQVDPRNGWVVRTRDRSLSAHFEHTVAMTPEGPLVLTQA